MTSRFLVFVAACVLAGAAVPRAAVAARPVRVFVVNARLELGYADTYASYRDKMFALADAAHPRRGELVQDGVGDVASHVRPRDAGAPEHVLVAFPEDVGLIAGLIGSRGAAARAVTMNIGGSTTAFFVLTIAYQPQMAHYAERFPGLPGLAYLFLAETDTYYRGFYETFRALAQTYGVYVAASANVAPARRVEAATEPALVALLRDPDEALVRDYAYEAVAPTPVNTLFVFAPDGEVLVAGENGATARSPSETAGVIRGSLNKAYLTEVEQDPLGLAFGAVRDLDVLDTPVGRIGSVTSKDAWMIDVNDRYDAKGADLIIQAEAFDSWGFQVAPWAPDGFKAGGFAHVQRNPSFRFNLTPCLAGNLFEVTFDGQGAVIGKRAKTIASPLGDRRAWIGQNADSGFVAVAPWIADDPGPDNPFLTLAERRTALVTAGRTLLPGSGIPCPQPGQAGPCENGYRESIVQVDLALPDPSGAPPRVPAPPVPTAFEAARFPVAPGDGDQRHPAVAAYGGRVYVAWQERRGATEQVYLATSADGGESFAVQRVSDHAEGAAVELRPDVALSPDGARLFVVWQEFCDGHDDDCGRIQLAQFDVAGGKVGADVRVDAGADAAGKWNPVVAVDRGGHPMVAWVDERDAGPFGIPLEHVYFSRSRDRGRSMGRNVRVDRGAPAPFAASLDNKWAPAIAVQGRSVFVAWADFRNYNWDIYLARSRDGRGFERSRRVDDAAGFERIHDHPALAAGPRGRLHAVWADRRAQDPDTDVRHAHTDSAGRGFSASVIIDRAEVGLDPNTETPSNQWHPAIAVNRDDVFVVWQDNRLGDNDIFFAHSRDGGLSFDADERVDDSGGDPSDQYRPDVAADPTDRTVYVAWEDERFGPASIAVTRRALRTEASTTAQRGPDRRRASRRRVVTTRSTSD